MCLTVLHGVPDITYRIMKTEINQIHARHNPSALLIFMRVWVSIVPFYWVGYFVCSCTGTPWTSNSPRALQGWFSRWCLPVTFGPLVVPASQRRKLSPYPALSARGCCYFLKPSIRETVCLPLLLSRPLPPTPHFFSFQRWALSKTCILSWSRETPDGQGHRFSALNPGSCWFRFISFPLL